MTNQQINAYWDEIKNETAAQLAQRIYFNDDGDAAGMVANFNDARFGPDVKTDIIKLAMLLEAYLNKVASWASTAAASTPCEVRRLISGSNISDVSDSAATSLQMNVVFLHVAGNSIPNALSGLDGVSDSTEFVMYHYWHDDSEHAQQIIFVTSESGAPLHLYRRVYASGGWEENWTDLAGGVYEHIEDYVDEHAHPTASASAKGEIKPGENFEMNGETLELAESIAVEKDIEAGEDITAGGVIKAAGKIAGAKVEIGSKVNALGDNSAAIGSGELKLSDYYVVKHLTCVAERPVGVKYYRVVTGEGKTAYQITDWTRAYTLASGTSALTGATPLTIGGNPTLYEITMTELGADDPVDSEHHAYVFDAEGFETAITLQQIIENHGAIPLAVYQAAAWKKFHIADGKESAVIGKNALAQNDGSTAFGEGVITAADNQTVVGQYNEPVSDALFVVGAGTDDGDRRNAFVVKADGAQIGENKVADETNALMAYATIVNRAVAQRNEWTKLTDLPPNKFYAIRGGSDAEASGLEQLPYANATGFFVRCRPRNSVESYDSYLFISTTKELYFAAGAGATLEWKKAARADVTLTTEQKPITASYVNNLKPDVATLPEWDSSTDYKANDKVAYDGTWYNCVADINATERTPAEDTPHWKREYITITDLPEGCYYGVQGSCGLHNMPGETFTYNDDGDANGTNGFFVNIPPLRGHTYNGCLYITANDMFFAFKNAGAVLNWKKTMVDDDPTYRLRNIYASNKKIVLLGDSIVHGYSASDHNHNGTEKIFEDDALVLPFYDGTWMPIWSSAATYAADEYVKYGQTVWKCTEAVAGGTQPATDPAHWEETEAWDKTRQSEDAIDDGTAYGVNEYVKHNGRYYRCKAAITTATTTTPKEDGVHWEDVCAWQKAKISYTASAGDIVRYNGVFYKCIADVTTDTTTTPAANAACWRTIPTWSGATTYSVNDIVSRAGKVYKAKASTNTDPATDTTTWSVVKLGNVAKNSRYTDTDRHRDTGVLSWAGRLKQHVETYYRFTSATAEWVGTRDYVTGNRVSYGTEGPEGAEVKRYYNCIADVSAASINPSVDTPDSDNAHWKPYGNAWSSSLAYEPGDLVYYVTPSTGKKGHFRCLSAVAAGATAPDEDNVHWTRWVEARRASVSRPNPLIEVVNNGIGQWGTHGIAANIDNLIPQYTKMVIICVGINDRNEDIGDIKEWYREVFDGIRRIDSGIRIIAMSATDPYLDPVEYSYNCSMARMSAALEEVCMKKGVKYIDLFSKYHAAIAASNINETLAAAGLPIPKMPFYNSQMPRDEKSYYYAVIEDDNDPPVDTHIDMVHPSDLGHKTIYGILRQELSF